MRGLAAAVVVLVVLAGCSGEPDEPAPTTGPIEGTGTLQGTATDEEVLPLPGVSVSFVTNDGRVFATQTRSDGTYVIDKVPPGRFEVGATKIGYTSVTRDVTMLPGQDRRVDFELTALGTLVEPYNSTVAFRGRYECSTDLLGSGQSCDALLGEATGESVFDVQNNHSLRLASGWGGILFEVDWSVGSGTQLVQGVRLIAASEHNGTTLVHASGSADPLRTMVNVTETHAGSRGGPLPAEGGTLWVRIEPVGASTPQCPIGDCPSLGGGVEMEYTVFVTTFFNSGVDPEYTAVSSE